MMDVPELTQMMDVPEMLGLRTPFMGTMVPRAEFPQDILDQLELLRPPQQLFYQGTDLSLLHSFPDGRPLVTCLWEPHGIPPPAVVPDPAATTRLFVLHFPFKFCGQSFVRYYSAEVGDKIWSHCQRVAATYGINIYQDGIYDVHPVHRLVEGRYRLDQEPTPLILTPPMDMHRRDYPDWIRQFIRDIYELVLDRSLQSPCTQCLNLSFGFLEENAYLPRGPFKATAIVRPANANGRLWADDFSFLEFRQLANGSMAATVLPSFRWMLNRHSNARPMYPMSILDVADDRDVESTLVYTSSDAESLVSVPDSGGSEPDSDSLDISALAGLAARAEMSAVRWTTLAVVTRDHPGQAGLGSRSEWDAQSAFDISALAAPGAPWIRDAQSEPGSEVNLFRSTVPSHSRIDVPSSFQGLSDAAAAAPLLDGVGVAQALEIYKIDVLPCIDLRECIVRPWVELEIVAPTPVPPTEADPAHQLHSSHSCPLRHA